MRTLLMQLSVGNIYLRNRTQLNKAQSSKQRNLFVKFLTKGKKVYYGNLNESKLCDNKSSWENVKTLLSNSTVCMKK